MSYEGTVKNVEKKLRVRNSIFREFFAEFIGIFILCVSTIRLEK
jgi:hypothetical protein